MIYPVWMIPQLWTLITNNFFFQSLTAASYHSARRACPELQNPLLQKAKENLLPGEKGPVSGRMRDDEKGIFPEPYPASGIVPLSRRAQLILRMIDSATSPFGSAQNDSIGGDVWESNENKGKVLSCSCGSDTNHLALPCCAPSRIKGVWVMLSHISYHLLRRVTGVAHGRNFNS